MVAEVKRIIKTKDMKKALEYVEREP